MEGPLVEINNSDELEAWLRTQPREVSVAFAARAALRVLPHMQGVESLSFFAGIALTFFRAAVVALTTAKYPDPATRLRRPTVSAVSADAADGADARAFWSAVSIDATRVEEGAAASVIINSALWPQGQPNELQSLWQEMKKGLLDTNQDWQAWTRWYDDRIAGHVRDEEHELAYVRIDDVLWKHGPAIVNAEIKKRIEELEPRHYNFPIEAGSISGSASMSVTDNKPRRRRTKELKPSPALKVPAQRPAALEPVRSNGRLVLPSTSATTDGESALKVVRQEITEFADDADGEANIDKRPIAYLRRNAERIAYHAPTQEELSVSPT